MSLTSKKVPLFAHGHNFSSMTRDVTDDCDQHPRTSLVIYCICKPAVEVIHCFSRQLVSSKALLDGCLPLTDRNAKPRSADGTSYSAGDQSRISAGMILGVTLTISNCFRIYSSCSSEGLRVPNKAILAAIVFNVTNKQEVIQRLHSVDRSQEQGPRELI